jgi:mono/diheme cytochrome c family protein
MALGAGVILCGAILRVAAAAPVSAQAPEVLRFGKGRPVPSGDVAAGQNIYNAVCWACHERDLSGYKGPPLTGSSFYKIWRGRKAGELAELIQNRMPQDDPGWLTRKSAQDVVAYIVTYANNPKSLADDKTGK